MAAGWKMTCYSLLLLVMAAAFTSSSGRDVMSARVELHWMTFEQTARGQEVHQPGSPSVSHNVAFKAVPGAPPDLLLLDAEGGVTERIDLAKYNQQEINDLLIRKGFFRKEDASSTVPEEYLTGPYKELKEDL